MLQINGEKMAQEYSELVAKQKAYRSTVEQAARAFAVNRGYDEAKTAQLVSCVLSLESDGLTESEREKLAFFNAYVVDVGDKSTATVRG